MRGARATLIAILLVGTAATAAAGDMTLTRSGDLFRVAQTDDGLVLSHRSSDDVVTEHLIPQTAAIAVSSVQVGADDSTGNVFVIWQDGVDLDARIDIAWFGEGTWSGPFTIAGGDGTAAENPQIMLDRVVTLVEDDDGPVEVATTFLHVTWWSFLENQDDGTAFLASFPLDATGNPMITDFEPLALGDLLPYGVGCVGIENAAGLAHPKLFVNPESRTLHVFATDFPNCAFQIVEVDYDVVEDWVGDLKRRRHIVLLGHTSTIALNPDMVLASAKVEVGHGLDVVMYWDIDDAVEYVQLDENGMPPVQSVAIDDGLSREQAEDMIRNLVH